MDLTAWITYLNNLHLRSIDLELGRMQRVAKILNITQPACPVVTVAGTNGKGSVVGFLEALYVNADYNVAAYTSPYLISFNEQFRLNQQWINDETLCHYFEKINQARGEITLTLFEFKTLAALLYFADSAPDLMILEVGLGGRLDSVNMIDSDIAVITSISLDHCDWLGDTRELIGREKAGIFRSGKPAVCGDLHPPVSIQKYADEIGAPVFYRHKDFDITENQDGTWNWQSQSLSLKNLPQPNLLIDNIATALKVVDLLFARNLSTNNGDEILPPVEGRRCPIGRMRGDKKHFVIDEKIIRETIATTTVAGRQQIISHDPFIVVDVSHNEDSILRLTEFLDKHRKKNITAIFSVLKTKDLPSIARIISPYIAEWHIAEVDHPDAMPLAQLQAVLQQFGAQSIATYPSIKAAYCAVRQSTAQTIAAFGSFHVVGEVLAVKV